MKKSKIIMSILMFFVTWVYCFLSPSVQAQQGFGIRFSSDFNHFHRPLEHGLIDGWFSTGKLGVYWSNYLAQSGFELGLNVNHKGVGDPIFPNLPVVMQNFKEGQNSGFTALEMDFKVGPRFGIIHPKIGYILGYRFNVEGFRDGADEELNKFYFSLPFGASASLKTNYGYVGFGAFYHVGVSNILKNPNPNGNINAFEGGRMRSINFEITVIFARRR